MRDLLEGLKVERRNNTIDALKGIGIMSIVLVHMGGNLPGLLGKIGVNGAKAVQLFLYCLRICLCDPLKKSQLWKTGTMKK